MAAAVGLSDAALPRLLYVGDVSVADTMAGEALLFRLLQFYPPDRLAVVCGVRPDMPRLPGVAYHHYGPAFPRLLRSRIAEEYVLWRAWRYYEVPTAIAHTATMFKPDAILSISHVSGWLAAWQLALQRRIPLHLIVHDDFVYGSRFPAWSRGWADDRFGEAYRAARGRFCISDTMAETYERRFGVPGQVIYPTHSGKRGTVDVSPRVGQRSGPLTFAYGGSLNSALDVDQLLTFARVAAARGHRVIAFTPQHAVLQERASRAAVPIEAFAPVHSDELAARLRSDADCLFLPQSMAESDRQWVATAFPSKWADYSTLGLPMIVWAPPESSSARFIHEHPGCAELVTSPDPATLDHAIAALEGDAGRRASLAAALLQVGRAAFSPDAAWQRFRATIVETPTAAVRE